MRLVLTSIALVSAAHLWAQETCEAFVDWQYLQPIDVYSAPDGVVIGQIRNDSVAEDIISLTILDSRKKHLRVKATMSISGKTQTGWLKQADYIGVYYREEHTPTMDLTLYKTSSPKKAFVVKGWTPGLLTVVQCKGEWVFVSVKHNGKKVVGWIRSVDLCANPYSTCS